jgi:hypothetical protein
MSRSTELIIKFTITIFIATVPKRKAVKKGGTLGLLFDKFLLHIFIGCAKELQTSKINNETKEQVCY